MAVESPYDLFDELRGEVLSAVTFVQDYLQLAFDGPGISVFNPLTVATAEGAITSWGPGFRDRLCGQIAKVVEGVEVREGEALVVRFADGSTITVSLRAEDYEGPEAIHAGGFRDGQWAVI